MNGLSKSEKENLGKLMLAEANIGKLDIFDEKQVLKYYEDNNLEKQKLTRRQYELIVKEVKKQSRNGLDPEQLLATTVIRNISILDKVENDLELVGKHTKMCEEEITNLQKLYDQLNEDLESAKEPQSDEEKSKRAHQYEVLAGIFDKKQKVRNSMAGFMKMRSALYKNVNEITKNQTDLNYKMVLAVEAKRKNDIMAEQLRLKNNQTDPNDTEEDDFKYEDCDIEELEEMVKIQASGKKYLLEGIINEE